MTLPNILGKEFVCINKIMRSLPVGGAIGDDCAVISWGGKNLLVSVDTFVEKVHFDLRYFELHEVGERCAEASLSDIAAMGGKAMYVTLSLSVPDHKMIEAVTKGVKRSLTRHKVKLVGGDTTFSKSIIVSFTVIGEASKPIYRSGAKPKDSVYISSYTGLSYGGFHVLKNKIKGFDTLKAKHKTPKARLDIANKISKYANSMIDISDGLVSELYHLAHASEVSIVIDNIPLHSELKRLAKISKSHKHDPKIMALYGGEDFELLYTVPKQKAVAKGKGAATTHGIKIGNVIKLKGKPAVYIKTTGGNVELLPPDIGFKHFI